MARQLVDLIDKLEVEAEGLNFARSWMVKRTCDLLREIIEPTKLEREQEYNRLDEARAILSCRLFFKLAGKQCCGCYLQWNCNFLAEVAKDI